MLKMLGKTSKEAYPSKALCLVGWGALLTSTIILCIKLLQAPGFWFNMSPPYYFPDALQLAGLYNSVMINGDSWSGWIMGASPYLFPDAALFFLLGVLFGNMYDVLVAYGMAQIILLAIGLQFLANSVFQKTPGIIKFGILFACMWVTLILAQHISSGETYNVFLPILKPAFHFGALLSLVFALGLTIRLLDARTLQKKIWFASLLFCISFLTVLSDFIYIVQGIVPVLLSLLFFVLSRWITWQRWFFLSAILTVACVLGVLLNMMYLTNGAEVLNTVLDAASVHTRTFFKLGYWGLNFISDYIVYSCVTLLFLICSAACITRDYRHQRGIKREDVNKKVIFLLSFLLILCVVNISAVLWAKIFPGISSSRYFFPLLILPVCIGAPVLLHFFPGIKKIGEKRRVVAFLAIFVLALPLAEVRNMQGSGEMKRPYPHVSQCLDDLAEKYNIRQGVGPYCYAKPLSLFSKNNVSVLHVLSDFFPHGLFSFPEYEKVEFDFIIAGHYLTEEKIVEKFGEPKNVFSCEDIKILTYEDNAFKHMFLYGEVFQETQYGKFYRS